MLSYIEPSTWCSLRLPVKPRGAFSVADTQMPYRLWDAIEASVYAAVYDKIKFRTVEQIESAVEESLRREFK